MKRYFAAFIFAFTIVLGYAQQDPESYKIMFYNVENLFDTYNDSLTDDEEFLPDGDRFWTNSKYYSKVNNIYKVIVAIGGWEAPAIIGLCEIENRRVLKDLVNNTPLVKFEYQIIHQESPDERGIDVGFLYRKEHFHPICFEAIPIHFPDHPESKTRDILYVKGIAEKKDTLNLFMNHWPSRWGGQLESEDRRLFVASVLKSKVDSIFKANPKSNIIIAGDFNDYYTNKSIHEILKASQNFDQIEDQQLYNLSSSLYPSKNMGSHKYQGKWGILDQFIVSGNLLNQNNKLFTSLEDIHIFNASFLLEPDEGYFGYRPKRTYEGYKYRGGFSDHLPTYLILNFNTDIR